MKTLDNTVSSFFFYMWNSWCEEECRIVFTSVGYKHFWDKWCIASKNTAHGAAEKFYAELTPHNRALLVNRACELYDGSKSRTSSPVVPEHGETKTGKCSINDLTEMQINLMRECVDNIRRHLYYDPIQDCYRVDSINVKGMFDKEEVNTLQLIIF